MTPVPTESLVVINAVSSTSSVSICAVPSICKSSNSFELDPRSLAPSSSGKISPPASKLPPIVVIPAIATVPCG